MTDPSPAREQRLDYSQPAATLVGIAHHVVNLDAVTEQAQLYKTDRLPGIAATLACAVRDLTGPAIDEAAVRDGTLALIGAVESRKRGDSDAVHELRPSNLCEAATQVNAAVAILAEITALPGGTDYLASIRQTMLAPTPEENNTDD